MQPLQRGVHHMSSLLHIQNRHCHIEEERERDRETILWYQRISKPSCGQLNITLSGKAEKQKQNPSQDL